jgi:tetratricopeptide (TPR) repeat protein
VGFDLALIACHFLRMRSLPSAAFAGLLAGLLCIAPAVHAQSSRVPAAPPYQALSMLGDTLRALPLSPAVQARYEAQLAAARRAYVRTPTNVDSIIWYARRLGYLGKLRESIEIYTRGITLYPDNPWLYRHRGHRYISVRDFASAVTDLKRADELTRDKPDEVEPDGQPNAKNTPIGTLKSNIGYHLALAYYLQGSWGEAAQVAQREVDAATNDDRRVSMAHWLYMSLRRAGRNAEAAKGLQPMRRNMNIIENQAYHKLMLLYKGLLPPDSVLTVSTTGELSVQDASAAYGVANWHWYNGRRAEAEALYRRIVDGGQWGAFGTIAAEVELSRSPNGASPRR